MKFNKADPKSKPTTSNIVPENIPAELKNIRSWGPWIWKKNKSKTYWTKVPIDVNGDLVDTRTYHMTFKEVMKVVKLMQKGKLPPGGPGFNFNDDHDFLGIDKDNCVVDGVVDKKTQKLIDKLDSWWEYSVSGEGIHILGKGSSKLNGVDESIVFHKTRFFTFSSDMGPGANPKIKNIGKKVNKIFLKKVKKGLPQTKGTNDHGKASIQEIGSLIKDIRPNLPEPEWHEVIKAIHNKSGGSDAGHRLACSWSAGDYCNKEERYDDYDESEVTRKWNRCDPNKKQQIGFPRLQQIKVEFPIFKKRINFDNFKKESTKLLTVEIHKEMVTQKLFPKSMDHITRAAKEIARFSKVQLDPIISTMLIVGSAAINKKVIIQERKGLTHNAAFGLLIGIPTGGKKSAIDRPVMEPFRRYEEDLVKTWQKERYRHEAQAAIITQQIKNIHAQLMEDPENEELMDIMVALKRKLEGCKTGMPKLIEGDITEEKLSDSLMINKEIMLIQSDDARNIIKNITGRYDSTSESIYIAGLTGDPYRRSRVKNDVDVILHNPCINMTLKVQMDLIQNFVEKKQMADSGLIARMFIKTVLIDQAEQMIVEREDDDLDQVEIAGYNKVIEDLMNYQPNGSGKVTFTISGKARKTYSDLTYFFADLVRGDWSGYGNVSNKVVSSTVRMAVVMMCMAEPKILLTGSGPGIELPIVSITSKWLLAARDLIKVMVQQTIEIVSRLEDQKEVSEAIKLLDKLTGHSKKTDSSEWTLNDIRMMYSSAYRDGIERSIGILMENGLITRNGFNYELSE